MPTYNVFLIKYFDFNLYEEMKHFTSSSAIVESQGKYKKSCYKSPLSNNLDHSQIYNVSQPNISKGLTSTSPLV